ncbi:MAG: hypothetical protein ACTSWQ_09860 [Candidatus Thorarchaeota archaeon]
MGGRKRRIDVLMTAVIRPDLLCKILTTFRENLFREKDRYRLVINIDPVGDRRYTAYDVLAVAKEFFDDITYNIVEDLQKADVTKAARWCFEHAINDFCFWLEDDWKMIEVANIDKLIAILQRHKNLASIDLNRNTTKAALVRSMCSSEEWVEEYHKKEILKQAFRRGYAFVPRIAFGPTLIKREFVEEFLPLYKDNANAELQLRYPSEDEMKECVSAWRYATYVGSGFKLMVEDAGRNWRQNRGWYKVMGSNHHFTWEGIRMVDVVTTATVRPKLLDQTYTVFKKNLLHPKTRFRLVINIDPVGNPEYTPDDVLKVAKSHFDEVIYNVPSKPNLSRAVIWCWEHVRSKIFFYLEDDWKLFEPINFDELAHILLNNCDLASIGLNQLEKERMVKELVPGEWKDPLAIQRKFAYLIRISLNPVLIRKEFAEKAVKYMISTYKPESQLRQPICRPMRILTNQWRYGVYIGRKGFAPVIADTGREWMEASGWKREKKDGFLCWAKKSSSRINSAVEQPKSSGLMLRPPKLGKSVENGSIPINTLCLDFREDIVLRVYVLVERRVDIWREFCSLPSNAKVRKTASKIEDMRKSIKEFGQIEPVKVVVHGDRIYPAMGAARISAMISLKMQTIKVIRCSQSEAPKWNKDWTLSSVFFKGMCETSLGDFKRWAANWKVTFYGGKWI